MYSGLPLMDIALLDVITLGPATNTDPGTVRGGSLSSPAETAGVDVIPSNGSVITELENGSIVPESASSA